MLLEKKPVSCAQGNFFVSQSRLFAGEAPLARPFAVPVPFWALSASRVFAATLRRNAVSNAYKVTGKHSWVL